MDAQQAARLIAEIESRLAWAGIGEGVGDLALWPDAAGGRASDAAARTSAEASA